MTSETDELRRLLDERGVEWEGCDGVGYMFTYWTTQKGAFSYFARESEQRYGTDELLLETTGSTEGALVVTAEQAVAATLGSRRNASLDNVDAERDAEFAKAMRRIVERNTEFGVTDIEESHRKADELMCDLLLAHGYAGTVDAFKNMRKWYG